MIDGKHSARALRSVHSSFYLSPHTVSIGLIGPGVVGSVLLDQLATQVQRLSRDLKLDLRVRGIMSSKRMHLADPEVQLARWRDAFSGRGEPADLTRFAQHIHAEHLPHAVIIDCSSSADVAARYPSWLASGIHIVTPNKKANSADLEFYARLHEARRAGNAHYLYEATVGAGLPVIQTLRDLRDTGDEIHRIEGMLSGTLAYLFNVWDGSEPFSSVVRAAKAKGYTEPDPRDDLSGTDFARKLIILGREMGLRLELGDVQLESLVPRALASCTAEEFLERLPTFDARDGGAPAGRAQPRSGAALHRLARCRHRQGIGRPGGAGALAHVRQHQSHGQRRAFPDAALQPESAGGAGTRRRSRSHRRRRVRRSAARVRLPRRETLSMRQTATAFAPASVGNVAVGFDVLGHSFQAIGDRVTARRTSQPGVTIAAITRHGRGPAPRAGAQHGRHGRARAWCAT